MTPDEFVTETGRRIRELRARRDLSQAALARRAGISVVGLNRIESAKQEPSLRSLVRIAEALSVQPIELFPRVAGGADRDIAVDALIDLMPPTDPATQERIRQALLALAGGG